MKSSWVYESVATFSSGILIITSVFGTNLGMCKYVWPLLDVECDINMSVFGVSMKYASYFGHRKAVVSQMI